MPRRGENIHKRKDGRWEARIKTEIHTTGRTKYISVYGKSYKEVKEKKYAFLYLQDKKKIQTDKTLAEVLELWLDNNSVRQKDSTKLKYQFIIEHHINPEIGHLLISEIDRSTINKFLYQKQQDGRLDHKGGLSPAYIKIIASILNASLGFAIDQKWCNAIRVPLNTPSISKKDLPILGKKYQIELENRITSNCTLTGLGILISLNAGLRIGEICALKWEDIDFEKGLILVRHTVSRISDTNKDNNFKTCLVIDSPKTFSSLRDIPISSKLLPSLVQMKKLAVSEYVISEKNTFVSPRTYEYRFHKLLELYGIPQINYHALRHTFATRCIEVGMDVKTLSELMGHSNVGITLNTYVHSSMELKRKQIEKLSNLNL